MRTRQWLCCQLGAREHYAIPRALQFSGLLRELITDFWIRPGALARYWRHRVPTRFHPDLSHARVTASNTAALRFELQSRASGLNGWKLIDGRNDWFQRHVVKHLEGHACELEQQPVTVFAYSYAANRIFQFARKLRWRTVLGQIDSGPANERLMSVLQESSLNSNGWKPAPPEYWNKWRMECELADRIVVNSSWSREALLNEGISAAKIRVIPLAFDRNKEAQTFQRTYPTRFSAFHPLKVLFLGQINLQKGVDQLFEAARLLAHEPVEFWLVGPQQIHVPSDLKERQGIKWFGAVPRDRVHDFYRRADVFILPTLSDGFGLTQLEAQSWKLPVIASRFCGEVVRDGINGVILQEVSAEKIAAVLLELLASSERLATMAENSGIEDRFTLKTLASSLSTL